MIRNPVYLYHADESAEFAKKGRVYCLQMAGGCSYLTKEEVVSQILGCEQAYSRYRQTIQVIIDNLPDMRRGRLLTEEELSGIKTIETAQFFRKGALEQLLDRVLN